MPVANKGHKSKTTNVVKGKKPKNHVNKPINLEYFYILERIISFIHNDLTEELKNQIQPLEDKWLGQFARWTLPIILSRSPESFAGISPTVPFMPTETLLNSLSEVLTNKEFLAMKRKIANGKNEEYPKGVSKATVDNLARDAVRNVKKRKPQETTYNKGVSSLDLSNLKYWYLLWRVISCIENDLPEELKNKILPETGWLMSSLASNYLFPLIVFGKNREDMINNTYLTEVWGGTEALFMALKEKKIMTDDELFLLGEKILDVRNKKYPEGVSKKNFEAFVESNINSLFNYSLGMKWRPHNKRKLSGFVKDKSEKNDTL